MIPWNNGMSAYLAVDFGLNRGIYAYSEEGIWSKLSGWDTSSHMLTWTTNWWWILRKTAGFIITIPHGIIWPDGATVPISWNGMMALPII